MHTNPFYGYANFLLAKITAKYEVILWQIIIWVYGMCNAISNDCWKTLSFPRSSLFQFMSSIFMQWIWYSYYQQQAQTDPQHNWFVNSEQHRAQWAEIKCCSIIRTNVFAHNRFNMRAYVPIRPLQSSNIWYMILRLATPSNNHVRLWIPNKMKSW